jgi:hypothetical protein
MIFKERGDRPVLCSMTFMLMAAGEINAQLAWPVIRQWKSLPSGLSGIVTLTPLK